MEAPKPFEQAVDLTVQRFMDSNSFALPGSADELYDYASTKAPPKAADYCYARNIMNVININHVIMEKVINQQAKKTSKDELEIGRWLMAGSKAGWVRFYPYSRSYFLLFRCYICCTLKHTGNMLNLLIRNFRAMKRRIPYFKIAAHDEARRRNDTIVTWFSSLNVAKDWANIALASPDHWRDGVAPPGQLYWQQTVSVDNEQAGTTTTTKVAEAAYDLLQQNLPFPPLE